MSDRDITLFMNNKNLTSERLSSHSCAPTDHYLNFNETREYLGHIPASTLREWTSNRLITSYKPGKKVYYLKSEIDAFMNKHCKRSHDRLETEMAQKKSLL